MTTISFDVPGAVGSHLAAEWGDLSLAAKESLAIESYRLGKISVGLVAKLLGFESRFEAEEWLGSRGVRQNYSIADLEADRRTLGELFGVKL